MSKLYQVVVSGVLTQEYEAPEAVERLGKAFRLDSRRAARLMDGNEHVVKRNIDESTAMQLMIKILDCGFESYVQELHDVPAYEEKRRRGERRLKTRRPPRLGAIQPDRRLKDRRRADREG